MKNTVLIFFLLPLVGIAQQNFNFMHDGMSRQYIYYSPANLAPDAPLVFVAHKVQVLLKVLWDTQA